MKKPRYLVGIDLGTTNTVVASADTTGREDALGRPAVSVFPIEQLVAPGQAEPRELLPSNVYVPAEGELAADDLALSWGREPWPVGELAKQRGARTPGHLVVSAKSWLSHGAVDRTAAILPWGAPEGIPRLSPIDASSRYLGHVRAAWDHAHPDEPLDAQDVVLTVPASFDEVARELTLRAARSAGLESLRLVEEPQAAFYDWLAAQPDPERPLGTSTLAIVVDVGGGTTDLTLIHADASGKLSRIAVGDHLLLGGDNMDLLLAKTAETRLGKGALDAARFAQLLASCRSAKERLLSDDAPPSMPVTVLGSGSRLIGGTLSTTLTREDVERLCVDGFFPEVGADARVDRKRAGLVEFGLPYASDPAITRHIATFLARHRSVIEEVLGTGRAPLPDAVLLNGGVFRSAVLRKRVVDVLGAWRGGPMRILDIGSPDLAVARGAVAYALARRGYGARIGGGSARAYYVGIGIFETDGTKRGVCIVPRGAEEGTELTVPGRTFALVTGRPARFTVYTGSGARGEQPGDIAALGGDDVLELPPLATVIDAGSSRGASPPSPTGDRAGARGEPTEITVKLAAALSEIGTLELSLIEAQPVSPRRWKLELLVRGDGGSGAGEPTGAAVTALPARFSEARKLIERIYGKSAEVVPPRDVRNLWRELARMLGEREEWDTALVRELFGAVLAGASKRRRTADHERLWFSLAGYCLRPGFGYALDDWRVSQLWPLFEQSVQHVAEKPNWQQWWILWRRVAGGLDESQQTQIRNSLAWYLEPPSPRPKARPKGPKAEGFDDMVRLVGSLERIPKQAKIETGQWLMTRIDQGSAGHQTWWAIGRLGARVPFYGSVHQVIEDTVAGAWLERVLSLDWSAVEPAAFAAAQLARVTGDRRRDLPESIRLRVAEKLRAKNAPPAWATMVTELVAEDRAVESQRVFGESLPAGLKLITTEDRD